VKGLLSKKALVIVGLVGLFGWGIYTTHFAANEFPEDLEVSSTTEIEDEVITGLQEGNKAPDFETQTLDGKVIKLSDLEGKKVILNLWATWCPPCKAEMPHMQDFYSEQQENEVEILAINLTNAEKSTDGIEEFVVNYGLTFPIGLDPKGQIGKMYQAITIPTSYIIDSKGIIRQKIIGPMNKEMMTELVESVE
jgi:peroxiredoxin